MRHPYKIREIAVQSGLSEATVDRVLNARGGVRDSTVRAVGEAIADLDRQRTQVRLGTRTFMIDVIVQASPRFSAAVRAALEAGLPGLRPAVIRTRFHLLDAPSVPEVVAALARARRGGSQGVILKAPDTPEIVAAAQRLDVPLITHRSPPRLPRHHAGPGRPPGPRPHQPLGRPGDHPVQRPTGRVLTRLMVGGCR
ncbi:LacI family DNA-binding transcriptional regulator [Winogradskya humida]|uniref:HTH lacI-type domain-containing protein n=1 Tax=Winogradskya humida TaxID=113566 RepID=A0ABQ4A5N9_9ACTN|nr:LacI family DNA-binding transcriptional regulator [Actinoplanes humidus]GIE26166.1 hypothetical protein Ahu01nite_092680 [Actinoplanes humidus]